MAKSKGPPYNDKPEEHFVVVVKPWGMRSAKNRVQEDIDILAAWLRIAFVRDRNRMQVEAVYTMSTRDEVIVRLSPHTKIVPALGSHKWSKFLKRGPGGYSDSLADNVSFIFEYNWKVNGDPERHNWEEHTPTSNIPPDEFPVLVDYPKPSWALPPKGDSKLRTLLLSLPPERQPTPPPIEPPVTDDEQVLIPNLPEFRPYQPPAHHPSHELSHYADPTLNTIKENSDNEVDVKSSIKSEEINSKLNKLDPYEEEEITRQLLDDLTAMRRSGHSLKKEKIKEELKPSPALVNALEAVNKNNREVVRNGNIKEESKPNKNMINILDKLNRAEQTMPSDKSLTLPIARVKTEPQTVKHEPSESHLNSKVGTSTKRPKTETDEIDFSSNRHVRTKLENM